MPDIDLKPTESMASNAERGLRLREEYGRGGTAVGVARARDIKNRKNLSPSTVKRMHAYFSRHEVDKKGKGWESGSEGYPSAGLIAWLLWGGDSGKSWAERKVNAMKNENSRMIFSSRGVKIRSATYEMIAKAFIYRSDVSEAQLKKADSVVERLNAEALRDPKNAPIFKSFASELKSMIKAIRARKTRKRSRVTGEKERFSMSRRDIEDFLQANGIKASDYKLVGNRVIFKNGAAMDAAKRAFMEVGFAPSMTVDPSKFSLSDSCWDGYEAVGTKKKDGKTVPNCVPK